MQHVHQLIDATPSKPTIVAIGMFDGIHLGHSHLLRQLVETAHAKNCTPVILTFFPHPDIVFGRASGRYYLMPPDDRAAKLGELKS